MVQYNINNNRRNDEFTATYKNYSLARIIASEPDARLLYVKSKSITTKETNEVLLAIEPQVCQGVEIFPMKTMFSRNVLTQEDVDYLKTFTAVDAVIRVGTYVGPDGKKRTSENPSVIALIDSEGRIFEPSGAKRQPKPEWSEEVADDEAEEADE